MAPRDRNLPNSAAEDTVFDNLGLTREDLGMDNQDDGFGSGNEDLEGGDGSGNDNLTLDTRGQDDLGDDGQGGQGDQSRVTHTDSIRPLPRNAEVKPDKQGNLVDATGKVVARRGSEARLYQAAHTARGQAQTLQGQLQEANTRLRKAVEIGQKFHSDLVAAQATSNAIKQFGLEQTEHLTALRLYKELRDNPKEAIKNILTRAAANGITVAELGSASGVDPKSLLDLVRQEIGKAVNPLQARTAAEEKQRQEADALTQRQGEIQAEVDSFFTENPEAKEFLPVFTQTIQQYPKMTLGEIWSRIQLHFARNPQDRRRNQNSRGQTGSRRSLPSGRRMPVGNGQDGEMAPVSDSYAAIVRAALDSAGVTR